jgi:riboflavin synthase
MFTGIVERQGRVAAVEDRPGSRRLTVAVRPQAELPPWRPAVQGESIAVDGVCLTVVEVMGGPAPAVAFDAVPETLEKTTLGERRVGDAVNLERALRVGDMLGGHHVTGHVDGVGRVRARRPVGDQVLFEIEAAPALLAQVLRKGSIAVDGISLTVVDVSRPEGWLSFAAIPHTLSVTTLGTREPGARVNLETDAFGKWILQGLAELVHPPDDDSLRSLLERAGFIDGGR